MIPWLHDAHTPLPPVTQALRAGSDAPGLLAAGGDLSPQRLNEAYSHGAFPWYSVGQPVLWWAPDPRMVLPVSAFRLTRSLRKTIQKFARTPGCELRMDSHFAGVIQACANTPREGQDGTWIVPEMVAAYRRWHSLGRVHSVETWIDGTLVGGLYAVNIGRMVFGESMFSHRSDASKIALAALVCFCRAHGLPLIDCQQHTGHLASLGARQWPREQFIRAITPLVADTAGTPLWSYHSALWAHLNNEGATSLDAAP
jgi:leucyl/phenylalanyl-tRNA--protein transferase